MELSLVIITRNEERNIAGCIGSVPFASETVVVDSGSKDSTVDIAKEMGAAVYHHPFESFSRQKQWAVEKASSDWILSLDADERLGEELAGEIQSLLSGDPRHDAYSLPFRILYMNRLMRFGPWTGEKHVRLFRKNVACYPDSGVHEGVRITGGSTGSLNKGYVVHESYTSLADQLEKMTVYARLWAEDEAGRGRRSSCFRIAFRPMWRFFSGYFLKGGFLEGLPGLSASAVTAFYVFQKWLLLHEMEVGK